MLENSGLVMIVSGVALGQLVLICSCKAHAGNLSKRAMII